MTLTSRERAALRSRAHALSAMVHVGHQGVTDTVRQTLDDALRTRELVKVQFSKTFDGRPKHIANDVAGQVNAEVVQAIGRTVTLFRENPELRK
ncbi:MAG: YhbY family RNA-binding protein [Gemmatimonadaceae bacterium]